MDAIIIRGAGKIGSLLGVGRNRIPLLRAHGLRVWRDESGRWCACVSDIHDYARAQSGTS